MLDALLNVAIQLKLLDFAILYGYTPCSHSPLAFSSGEGGADRRRMRRAPFSKINVFLARLNRRFETNFFVFANYVLIRKTIVGTCRVLLIRLASQSTFPAGEG